MTYCSLALVYCSFVMIAIGHQDSLQVLVWLMWQLSEWLHAAGRQQCMGSSEVVPAEALKSSALPLLARTRWAATARRRSSPA